MAHLSSLESSNFHLITRRGTPVRHRAERRHTQCGLLAISRLQGRTPSFLGANRGTQNAEGSPPPSGTMRHGAQDVPWSPGTHYKKEHRGVGADSVPPSSSSFSALRQRDILKMQMRSCCCPQLKQISITLSTDLFSRVFQSLPAPTHLHGSSQPPQLPTL